MSAQTKSFSDIITMFTQQNQQLELQKAKNDFDELTKEVAARRKELLSKIQKNVAKQTETVDASKAERFKSMEEHKIPLEQLFQQLESDPKNGLTKAQAEQKLQKYGLNQLSERKKVPWYMKLLHELTSPFALLLWVGSILCFIAYGLTPTDPSNMYLGIVLAVVNTLTGTVTYFQNAKSDAIMAAFKNFIPPETLVIREGQQQKIAASELVPGDVVIVEYGKRIPADLRVLESNEMKVDNSSLTGESLLLLRTAECTHPNNPLETKNMAFFGTLCKEGNGVGIVIFTGDNTVIGQIANLVDSSVAEATPLRKELDAFIKMISIVSICVGLVFFVLGFIINYPFITNLVFAIGIIVANVPEGLLATVTVSLTLTARKLACKKVLVKNLEGVETLGSTSCICSDKTGTLTQNKMTVENIWYNMLKKKAPSRQKLGPDFPYEYDINEIGFKLLHETAIFSSEATFDGKLPQARVMKIQNDVSLNQQQKDQKLKEATLEWENNLTKMPWQERPTIGDASETALIKFFQPIEDILYTRSQKQIYKDAQGKLGRMPFNSANKYAFVIVEYETPDSHYCLFTKGAPERIWNLCDSAYLNGEVKQKDETWEAAFSSVNESFGKQGERVLGFARCHLPKEDYPKGYHFDVDRMNFPFNKQAFVGLISLIDPPKDNVPYSVIKCKTAGIQVIMVTGDQPVTAAAIARQCNIITEKTVNEIMEERNISMDEAFSMSNALVIHGDRLTKMAIDDEGLPEEEKGRPLQQWLSKPQLVFARTSPAQKLIIVAGCQKRGHIVAVTGDGVNDSPAIKKADIGIAMGITGSDVAKDAADMILLNDDFSSIVIGIEEGRKIFDNLRKTASYVLTSNIPELLPFLAFIVMRIPLPLTTVLILCIDLGTDLVPSTSFVFEESELDIMTRKPRTQDDHLVSTKLLYFSYIQNGVVQTAGGFLQWAICFYDFGYAPWELIGMTSKQGVPPNLYDVFDPTDIWFGNSVLRNNFPDGDCSKLSVENKTLSEYETEIDWIYGAQQDYDLRMMLLECVDGRFKQSVEWIDCQIDLISPVTSKPYCYTTEASNYAQSSFFYAIIITQICNYQSLRTLKQSGIFQGLDNYIMYFGFLSETILMISLSYIKVFNLVFGTRDVLFIHFGIGSIPFALLMLVWNESRKYMIRNSKGAGTLPSWWARCVAY